MARFALCISCLLIIQVAFGLKAIDIPRKELAGPPSEFADHAIPNPLNGSIVEDSAYFEMFLKPRKNSDDDDKKTKLEWKTEIFVDSTEEWSLSVFSPIENRLKLKLEDPNGKKVHLRGLGVKGNFPVGGQMIPETTYVFETPITGTWKLKVSTKANTDDELSNILASSPQGAIIIYNKSKTRAHTHLNTYSLFTGSQIGLVTGVTEDETIVSGVRPTMLKDSISDAELEVYLPDGQEVDVQMHDDGLHGDLEANDGIYGATIDATASGVYRATAYITGTNSDGTAFVRTTQHLIPVVNDNIELADTAVGTLIDKERLNIAIPVTADQTAQDTLFRAYAEVYGTDASGNQVAVAWIGGMVSVDATSTVSLELNLNWLSVAGASYPITLQNVVLQETTSYIPVSQQATITVSTSSFVNKYLDVAQARTVTEITKEMRQGKRTRVPKASNNSTDGTSGSIVLLHGYCSSDNPWQANAGKWTNPAFFLNADANLSNEDFATLVYAYAEPYGTYSIVGHSQGGMVGLHLLNYFESGLDDATGGYLVQSVGTPYKGCTAAGSAANLGSLFGVGCGANTDLSIDGAKLWLAGISSDAKKQVAFYTTTYEQGKFFGDYCNLAMNALLQWPNDGTTEVENADLTGATNKGNTQKQCHTTGMSYEAQYYDVSRIQEMNANAAR